MKFPELSPEIEAIVASGEPEALRAEADAFIRACATDDYDLMLKALHELEEKKKHLGIRVPTLH